MSDDDKIVVPAPTPAPAPAPAPVKEVEIPFATFVKGGTTTMAYDNQLAQQKLEAEARRKKDDERKAIVRANPHEAHINEMKLGGHKQHAAIVLVLKHAKDTTEIDYIICELIANDDATLTLNMACPECAQRGIPDNFKVHQKNRYFELDARGQGTLWINPKQPSEVVTLAGTINMTEWAKCPNLGCAHRFRIETGKGLMGEWQSVLRMERA